MIYNVLTMNQTTKRTIVQCTCDQQRLWSVCASTHYIKQASWIARSPKKVHTVRSAKDLIRMWWVTLFIPLWTARLSKVNTISECSDQNVQLRRLTRVFARRTRPFVKPIDCRRYIRLAKALIRLLMCRLSVQANSSFRKVIIGFTMHRYPRAPSVVSLSKTLYSRILVLVSTQEDAALNVREDIWQYYVKIPSRRC